MDLLDSDSEETEEEVVEQTVEEIENTVIATKDSLRSKAGTKSKVWQYFGLEVGENGGVKDPNTPVCRIGSCQVHLKTKHSSISNLYSYLKPHHPNEYELVWQNKVQPT